MRTSKISQETTRVFNALSPNTRPGRTTRSAKSIATFALGYNGSLEEVKASSPAPSPSPSPSPISDIEDSFSSPPSRKRKFGSDSPILKTSDHFKTAVKREDAELESPVRAKPKVPARRTTSSTGTVTIHPPSNWESIYTIVERMRKRNPTAPVDTMGCEDLYWRGAPPREKRYHTLTALMLSSQTKDTVTAVAMQRLHTELVLGETDEHGKVKQSGLTVENILACDPVHLDDLIGKVGFHNNKTKYIKAAAQMLKAEYNFDIPDTVQGLMRLPGVGPKMAYLCMSAAWGIDEGIGVDVHVHRITNLWGWHSTKNPEETRAWLEGWLPKEKWHEINKLLVGLGQTVCLPVGRRCGECDLAGTGLCKSEIRGTKAKMKRVRVEKMETKEDGMVIEAVKEEKELQIKEEPVDQEV